MLQDQSALALGERSKGIQGWASRGRIDAGNIEFWSQKKYFQADLADRLVFIHKGATVNTTKSIFLQRSFFSQRRGICLTT